MPKETELDRDEGEPTESGVNNVYENSPLSTTGGKTPSFPTNQEGPTQPPILPDCK